MRVPKIEHYDDKDKVTYVHLEKPMVIPRLPVIHNEKQRDKLIKTIERMVRSSLEYKDLIKYLRTYIDMNECEFFHNVNNKKRKGVIEIHHEPFDLYTITSLVMTKQEKEMGYIDELVVAEEVMRIHYMGVIGLVPLSITPHELVHAGKLVIPLNCVYGRFNEFVRMYYDELKDTPYLDMLKDKIELTKKFTTKDLSILTVRYIYTVVDGFSLPEVLEIEKEAKVS